MALIPTRPTVEKRARLTAHPKEKNLRTLRAYAAFRQAPDDTDYVLDSVIEAHLAKDPDFEAWLKTNPTAGIVTAAGKKRRGAPSTPLRDAGNPAAMTGTR